MQILHLKFTGIKVLNELQTLLIHITTHRSGKHSSRNFSDSPISYKLTVSSYILLIRPFVLNIFYLCLYMHSLTFSTGFFAQGGLSVWVASMGSLAPDFQLGWSVRTPSRRPEGSKRMSSMHLFFLSSLPVGSFQADFVPQLKVTVAVKVAHYVTLHYGVLITIPPFTPSELLLAPGNCSLPRGPLHTAHTL